MAARKKRGKVKIVEKTKEETAVEEETAKVTAPNAEVKPGAEEPQEELQEAEEPAAEVPQEEVAPEVRTPSKGEILQQMMEIPAFRSRVISRVVKKLD